MIRHHHTANMKSETLTLFSKEFTFQGGKNETREYHKKFFFDN